MKRVIALLTLVVLPAMIFAQSNGKIAGTVTGADGTTLAGANVVILGTSYGAAADADGQYFISDVPAGKYTVQFQYIGYATTDVSNIIVSSGLTRNLDQSLQVESIAGQRVTVVAERPLIQMDETSSINTITADDLTNLPIRNDNELLATVPGVVVQDGEVYIRGGRENEVAYFINGTPTTSFGGRSNLIYVPQEATEEIQVQVGGYDASVGGANSGVVTRQINRGTNDWHGNLTMQSDGFGLGEEWLGTNSFGHKLLVGNISGPIVKDKIKFFAGIEVNNQGDSFLMEGKEFEFLGVEDQQIANANYLDIFDLKWPGYRETNDKSMTYTGSITQDFAPLVNNLSVVYTNEENWGTGSVRSMLRNSGATIETAGGDTLDIPGRGAYNTVDRLLIADELSYSLSKNTIIKLGVGYFSVKTEDNDEWFGNDWEKWYDGEAVEEYLGIDRDVWTPFRDERYSQKSSYKLAGITFSRPGTAPDAYYVKRQMSQISANGSFSTIKNNHTITAGFNYRKYKQRELEVTTNVMKFAQDPADGLEDGITSFGSYDDIPVETLGEYVTGFGYDLYDNETDDRTVYGEGEGRLYIDGAKTPSELGFYLQDKFEFNDIVLNAGVRIDVLDSDDETLNYPDSISVYQETGYIDLDEWKQVDAHTYIQPRIGVSFPVSDVAKLYGYYGKFAQMPDLNSTWFYASEYKDQIGQGGYYYGDNSVGYGLEPTTTTQYEVGYTHQLGDNMAIDITGFYKNQKGLLAAERIGSPKGDLAAAYDRRINGDFSTVKGIEFKYTLRRTNRLAGDLNYTFSSAKATGSDGTSYIGAIYQGSDTPKQVMPVEYNQPHVGSIRLDYRYGNNDGGPILENSGVNVLFNFSSGHSWTAVTRPTAMGQATYYNIGVDYMNDTRSREAIEALGSSQTPWAFNTDLRIDKKIPIGSRSITAFMRVTNLFNARNVINVYQITGSADDDGWLTTPGIADDAIAATGGDYNNNGIDDYYELYNAVNIDNDEAYRTEIGGRLISAPRQIFVGLTFNF